MSLVTETPFEGGAALLAPIDPQQPVGVFDIEDETYQAIDQEMVKLGGLHEASIDWLYIEEAARQYLIGQCKHFRIASHLIAAWLRCGSWESWCRALELLAGMVERYWETAYPKPGPTGYPGKRKQAGLLLKRLSEGLSTLEPGSFSPVYLATAEVALAGLVKQAVSTQLDPDVLAELERCLIEQASAAITPSQAKRTAALAPSRSNATLTEAFFPGKPSASPGNERETRHAVLRMAEYINQQDFYDPTGYQLRRFGLWAHLHATPSSRPDHCTELAAVPSDIVLGYEEALSSTSIEPALLLRVEKSVSVAPYWIRGSFLAAGIATRLAMGEVAEAIRMATERFVRRLPALQQLRFSDGSVFVDKQCLAWLKGNEPGAAQDGAIHEFRALREELIAQLDNEGVERVLLRLQALQANYHSPRERCHATLIAADLLAARGLSWLADDLCAGIARTMQVTTAQQWEPQVYQRLKGCGVRHD